MQKLFKYRRAIVIAGLVLCVYWGMGLYGSLDAPRLKMWDLFLRLKYKIAPLPDTTKDIVIIAIDDISYAGRWPWNRNIFANLIYKLNTYKPAVIGLSFGFFDESIDSKAGDSLFAESLKYAGNVILASCLDKNGKHILPCRIFNQKAAGSGFSNKPLDEDNIIRWTKTFIESSLNNEILYYSFDVKVAEAFLKSPVDADGSLYINYTAKPRDFEIVSFADAATGKIPLDFIKDKIVLVGITDEVFNDINLTPFGKMPGVVITANTINMFISGNLLTPVTNGINILAVIVFGLVTGILTFRKNIFKATLLTFIIFAFFAVISIVLALNKTVWDFFGIPAVVLAIYAVNCITNYTEVLLQGVRVRKIVITDPVTSLPTRRYFLLRLERQIKSMKDMDDISLVLFSIDNFNEPALELGTENANSILKEVAGGIVKSSRKTRNIDFICRYGETQFCSQLNKTDIKGALAYANRIKQMKIDSLPSLSLSAGIVNINDLKYRSAVIFVKCAESALARAIQEENGNVVVYNPEKDHVPIEELKEEKEISETDLSYVAEEYREKHKELAILVNKLRIARDDLIKTEKLSAVGKVAAGIHHDLSKPIANLKSLLVMVRNTLEKTNLPELDSSNKLITLSINEVDRLSKLSDNLRDLYRPQTKEILPVAVNQILDEMINLSTVQIARSRIKLIKNYHPQLPNVYANPGELKQVFLNIIINAVESMPNGGELEINTAVSDNMAEVSIRDTGYGISPENLHKLFKPFFTTKEGEKGAGLGLYSSMEIVKKYDGRIKVESAVNQGSTFKVYLPLTV